MKLIIVRHGETFENISGICQGQSDGTLSDKGKLQAKKVAERLKDEKIDALYSSDLQRTVDTANEILRYHPKIELKKDKLLRERYFGEFEGKPFGADFDWNNLPDSVETDKQMCDRVREFLEKVYPIHRDDTVVLVSHGGTKRAFFTVIEGIETPDFRSYGNIMNTSVSVFDIDENEYKMHFMGCFSHLDEDTYSEAYKRYKESEKNT